MVIPWLKCVLEIFRIRNNTKQRDFQCQNSEAPHHIEKEEFWFQPAQEFWVHESCSPLWPEYHFSSDPSAPGRFGTSLAPGRYFITSLIGWLNHWLDDWMIGWFDGQATKKGSTAGPFQSKQTRCLYQNGHSKVTFGALPKEPVSLVFCAQNLVWDRLPHATTSTWPKAKKPNKS